MGKILISRCREPQWNLALEEVLIDRGVELLFLWQNEPSVILGRNQDPYAECIPQRLQAENIHLVRRKSGGGAVYHDMGNLNITLLSPKASDALEKNFTFLRKALESLGIAAEFSGRNDLEVQGKKISGSAYYETDMGFCHHCTMLVRVNPEAMERYLTPSHLKLQSKGISSVRSRVCGLEDLKPGLSVEKLEQALIRTYGGPVWILSDEDLKKMTEVAEKAARYGSWEWTFGESPGSDLSYEEKFSWGLVKAAFSLHSGRIQSCRIYTDSLYTEGFRELEEKLRGLPFGGEQYAAAIRDFPESEIREDLLKLLCPSRE